MPITTRPADWPFALATIEANQVPCLVLRWEKGYDPSPAEWHARIVYARDGEARETLVTYRFITPVGRADGHRPG